MKRIFWLLLISLSVVSTIKSQNKNHFEQKVLLGIGAGPNFNRFFFTPSVSQHTLNGYWGGLIVRYDVESYASLQMEVNFSQSGWREKFENEGKIDQSYKREMQYIRVPILTNIHYDIDRFKIFVTAGPEFGYMLKERSVEVGAENMNEFERLRHDMTVARKFSWGLTGGIGVGAKFGRHNIELEGRYTYGFGDIWRTDRVDPYGKASESIIGVRLNYLITIN